MLKDRIDVSRFAEEKEGILENSRERIKYRLNVPAWLALTGQKEELEELLKMEGMTAAGISPEIFFCLKEPMYLKMYLKETEGTKMEAILGDLLIPDSYCGRVFYTTAEAAVMGGQEEIYRMLKKHGVLFDLRVKRTRAVFFCCRNRMLIRRILWEECGHVEEMLEAAFEGRELFGWNIPLMEELASMSGKKERLWLSQWRGLLEDRSWEEQQTIGQSVLGRLYADRCRSICGSETGRVRKGLFRNERVVFENKEEMNEDKVGPWREREGVQE